MSSGSGSFQPASYRYYQHDVFVPIQGEEHNYDDIPIPHNPIPHNHAVQPQSAHESLDSAPGYTQSAPGYIETASFHFKPASNGSSAGNPPPMYAFQPHSAGPNAVIADVNGSGSGVSIQRDDDDEIESPINDFFENDIEYYTIRMKGLPPNPALVQTVDIQMTDNKGNFLTISQSKKKLLEKHHILDHKNYEMVGNTPSFGTRPALKTMFIEKKEIIDYLQFFGASSYVSLVRNGVPFDITRY